MARDVYARRRNPLPLILGVLAPFVILSVVVVILAKSPRPAPSPVVLPSTEVDVKASVFIPLAEWDATADELHVAAILTARVDPEGTCTLVAVNGSDRLTVESKAAPDASTMTCGTMVIKDGVHPGEWSVTVSYRSGTFAAVSEVRKVEVG